MMTLHGVDVYLWSETTSDIPHQIGKFELTMISDRGTRIYPPPAPEIELGDWPRCRFLSDAVVSNDEIDALVHDLTAKGWNWTKCQKLFKKDGVNQFSEAY